MTSGPTEVTFCVRGVISPLLSNIVLHALDCELEGRGHRFVRYADDSNLYVKSERAGRRVMASVSHFIIQRLKLRVNAAKSAVDRPQQRTFLGFTFTGGKNPARRRLAPKAVARFQGQGPGADTADVGDQSGRPDPTTCALPHGVAGVLWPL